MDATCSNTQYTAYVAGYALSDVVQCPPSVRSCTRLTCGKGWSRVLRGVTALHTRYNGMLQAWRVAEALPTRVGYGRMLTGRSPRVPPYTKLTDGTWLQLHAGQCPTCGTLLEKEFVLWDGWKPRTARGMRAGVWAWVIAAFHTGTSCLAPFHALPRPPPLHTRHHTS